MQNAQDDLYRFCRLTENRSAEHQAAMRMALDQGWISIAASILRMEVDSLVRTIYLTENPEDRAVILKKFFEEGKFLDAKSKRLADVNLVAGAAIAPNVMADGLRIQEIYDFGKQFVHLTRAHQYDSRELFASTEARQDAFRYLREKHQIQVPDVPLGDHTSVRELAKFAPYVLEKISNSLAIQLRLLKSLPT